jgi:hypothetical protein
VFAKCGRYRERKKAKASELKQAVSSLQDKVNELSMVHAEKNELQVSPHSMMHLVHSQACWCISQGHCRICKLMWPET